MPNKNVQNQNANIRNANVPGPQTPPVSSALELDRDKNLSYRPHDEGLAEEAYGDGFEPLDKSGKTAGVYPADLQNDTQKKPNEKREKAWMQTNEGVTAESQVESGLETPSAGVAERTEVGFSGGTGGADPAAVKSTEVNQAVPDDQLKH